MYSYTIFTDFLPNCTVFQKMIPRILIIISISSGYEYHDCSEICMKYYSNLTYSYADGYNPHIDTPIKKPKQVTHERVFPSDRGKEKERPFGMSQEPPWHHHDNNFLCYGGSCLELEEDYDLKVMPYEESSFGNDAFLPVHVAMSIYVIDAEDGLVFLEFEMEVTWEDDRMRLCQCQDDVNTRDAIFPPNVLDKLYVPDVIFLDALQPEHYVYHRNRFGVWLTQFDSGVRVLWKRQMEINLMCDMNSRWYPNDVNACPVIITNELHNAHRLNLIMDTLPLINHVARSQEWHFGIEPLPVSGDKSFASYTKFGVSDLQYYTGFRIIIARKIVPPEIYTIFVNYLVYLLALVELVPMQQEKLTVLGFFLMAIAEMFDGILGAVPLFRELYVALKLFGPVYLFFLLTIGISLVIVNSSQNRYVFNAMLLF